MPEAPHLAILDRDSVRAACEEHFAEQIELLRDMASYGSNLVVRAFHTGLGQMADVIACGVHLKQVVAMIDAVQVLLASGCGHAAFLPARTAFEASVYLDWILAANSERRATRFLVANYRQERMWAKRAIRGTDEEQAMGRITAMLGLDLYSGRPTLAADAESHLAEVNRILAQPELAVIDQEFTTARGKRKRDPEWFHLDGLQSIREVAEAVGRLPEYEFFYSKGSQVTHTGSYKDHLRFRDGRVVFLPIRHLSDANNLLNFIVCVGIGTFRKMLSRYRPDELPAFTAMYLEHWRDPFQNAPRLQYDF